MVKLWHDEYRREHRILNVFIYLLMECPIAATCSCAPDTGNTSKPRRRGSWTNQRPVRKQWIYVTYSLGSLMQIHLHPQRCSIHGTRRWSATRRPIARWTRWSRRASRCPCWAIPMQVHFISQLLAFHYLVCLFDSIPSVSSWPQCSALRGRPADRRTTRATWRWTRWRRRTGTNAWNRAALATPEPCTGCRLSGISDKILIIIFVT